MPDEPLLIHVNGCLLAADAPAVSALDRGFLYGDGLFETVRAYGGVLFRLDAHLERLRASAAELRITEQLDTAAIAQQAAELLARNGLHDATLRITLTRGVHGGRLELAPAAHPTLVLAARPTRPLPPSLYGRGATAWVVSVRQNAASPLPRHKTLNYLDKLLAQTQARERGADQAILLDTRGRVAEAASSNLFLALDGGLDTPSLETNLLPGITRREVLRLARSAGIEAEERAVAPEELARADEIFLTNAVVELLPVLAVDGRPVGPGTPGPLTRQLHAAYREQTRQPTPERKASL